MSDITKERWVAAGYYVTDSRDRAEDARSEPVCEARSASEALAISVLPEALAELKAMAPGMFESYAHFERVQVILRRAGVLP